MHSVGPATTLRRALALAVVSSLLVTAPAYAAPTTPTPESTPQATLPGASSPEFQQQLSEKQKQLDEFNAQLDELDRNLEIATEEYNAALSRLDEIENRVSTAQLDLANAQDAYALQGEILAKRASSLYKDGSFAAVEILLDAKSMGDLVSRVKFLNTIGLRDAEIAASLSAQRDLLKRQVADLEAAQQEAVSLEFQAKARKHEIENTIAERQNMLAQAQTELLELLQAEAARRKDDESALLAEILSGANGKGIVVNTGSPVETALAYHGVPYVWGGESPNGFDCSGLVLYVFKQHGVYLPHYSGSQFLLGKKVAASALLPGDVVFFGSPVHHVGIYIGGGYYIHAPKTGDFVKISKLADRNDYAGGRRYDWQMRTGSPLNAQKTTTAALSGVSR